MQSVIEPIYKSTNRITFAWAQEPGAVSYKVYIGVLDSSLSLLAENISTRPCEQPTGRGKIVYDALIEDVQSVLSLASTITFSNKVFYAAITYVNSGGSESALADSTIVEIPPVGIIPKLMKDDPTINRHPYVFSDELQRWTKQMGSSNGALIVDNSDFYRTNITSEYTYDGTNVASIKSYPSDSTAAGSPAKLTTYTYSGSQVTKIQITDSTI